MTSYQTRSQGWLALETPLVSRELGKSAFNFLAPYMWNDLQHTLKNVIDVYNNVFYEGVV